jgi:hypothetical protein
MTVPSIQTSTPRSQFVTTVAWIFILFSAFGCLISLLQNVMFRMMPQELFSAAAQDSTFATQMPSGARFMFEHMQALVLISLGLFLITLTASIGLLRRHNWARLLFMGILALGAAYSLAGIFLQRAIMPSFAIPATADSTMRQVTQQFDQFFHIFQTVMLVMSLGFAALFGWLLYRMASPHIRNEFAGVKRAA